MPYLYKRWLRFFALSLLVVIWQQSASAQNYSVQNTYLANPFVINPAAAGSEYTQFYTSYRAQWLGMPGAPKYIYAGFNTLLDKTRAGVGIKGSSFSRGFLTTTDFSASFSYGVPINKANKLIMGLSGGVLMQSINWGQITDDTDPALLSVSKGTLPAISFGMLLKNSSGFNFGVVMPQMIRSETLSTNFQVVPDNLVVMAYYSNWHPQTGVKSHNRSRKHAQSKKDGIPWEIYTLYRYTKSGGQAEVFAKYNAKGVYAMLGYRQGFGLIPGVGFNLGKLSLQYTYEPGLGGEIPLKSHDFLISAKLGDKKTFKGDAGKTKTNTAPPNPKPRFPSNNVDEPKFSKSNNKNTKSNKNTTAVASNKNVENKNTTSGNTPRNRPTDTNLNNVTEEKKTASETKTEEKKQPVVTQTEEKKTPVETKTEEKKQPVVTQTEEKKTPTETKTEEKKQPVVTQTEEKKTPTETKTEEKTTPVETKTEEKKTPVETKTEEKKTTTPGEVVHLTEEEQSAHEEDVLARLEEHSDNPTEEHAGEEHPHAERHEFWAKGNHEKELEIGHYVIVGVFKSEANAKRVSDGYRNLGFSEVDYGFQSGKGFWFVHIAGSEDMDVPEAGKLRNKYRKMKMFKDAWLLTVHQ